MDVSRTAALVTIAGGLLVVVAVGLVAGYEFAILASGVLLMAAGVSALRSFNG